VLTLQSQRHVVGRSISYGKTSVVFIDPGAKVNSSYYCNVVLEKGLLPDIRAMPSLQVDTAAGWSASAHRPDHDGLSEKRAHQIH